VKELKPKFMPHTADWALIVSPTSGTCGVTGLATTQWYMHMISYDR